MWNVLASLNNGTSGKVLISCMCKCAGARVDTWVETGTEILPFFDSLLAKLMVHGSSRQDAVAKLQEALSNTIIGGIPSNLEYLEAIACSERFAAGHLAHPLSAAPFPGTTTLATAIFPAFQERPWCCIRPAPPSAVFCSAVNYTLPICSGATTTRFLEDLSYCPKAIEVLDPGMSTTVQVRPAI